MKRLALFACLLLLLSPVRIFGQDASEPPILESPDSWKKEVIRFPLGFAPSLSYQGVEDLRFSEGWSKKDSPLFWTYAFVWYLDEDPQLSPQKLEEDFVTYFNGLMDAVSEGQEPNIEVIPQYLALFMEGNGSEGSPDFTGKVITYDAFFTRELITLNFTVRESFCEKTGKYVARFNISPQPFGHEVWEKFGEVKMGVDCGGK